MYLKCCVPGSGSLRQDAILHKFPMCEKILQKWLDCICDSLRNKSSKELLGKLQVCYKHFEAHLVTATSRLLSGAFPTLFLPSEITSGIPLEPTRISEMVHPIVEHNYARREHNDHNYCTYPAQESQSLQQLRPKDDVSHFASVAGASKNVDDHHQVLEIVPVAGTSKIVDDQMTIKFSKLSHNFCIQMQPQYEKEKGMKK